MPIDPRVLAERDQALASLRRVQSLLALVAEAPPSYIAQGMLDDEMRPAFAVLMRGLAAFAMAEISISGMESEVQP